jgi:hypothetical protein
MHNNPQANALVSLAADELESLRSSTGPYPVACCRLLWSIPGNDRCVDCGSRNPEWANVSFGTLVCIQCCGRHRSFGVHISKVRSVHMDAWSHSQVLCMLEGGNEQLLNFFDRHQMGNGSSEKIKPERYHTKAASFYRAQLAVHVEHVGSFGKYPGRAICRQRSYRHQTNPAESTKASKPVLVPVAAEQTRVESCV